MNSSKKGHDAAPDLRCAESPKRVAVVMAVHNRGELTARTLRRVLGSAAELPEVAMSIVVVDDGSTDGTADVLAGEFRNTVTTVTAGGDLFWARAMNLAVTTALKSQWDVLIWLNDDVDLNEDWLARLLHERSAADVVVGAMRGEHGEITYSGLRRAGRGPGSLVLVPPGPISQPLDSFQGNLVLMTRQVAESLGGPDPIWSHGYGDIDYGYRAHAAGFSIALAPGTFGVCPVNPPAGGWMDPDAPRLDRVKSLLGRKGLPLRDHWTFNRRHGGLAAPIWFGASYLTKVLPILLARPPGRRVGPGGPPSPTLDLQVSPVEGCQSAKFSVVIASAGRPDVLATAVNAWMSILPPQATLVVSVPDEASLPTEPLPDSVLVTKGTRGSSAQRNEAMREVSPDDEFIFFFDDDCLPHEQYAARAIAAFVAEPGLVGTTGTVLLDGAGARPISVDVARRTLEEAPLDRAGSSSTVASLYGCNFAVRRAAVGEDRFDENLPLYGWLEDEDFSRRVGRRGRLALVHGCLCVHLGTPTGGRTSHRRFGYSQVVNPYFIWQKRTIPTRRMLYLIAIPLIGNLAGIIGKEGRDRRLRLRGNLLALRQIVARHSHPTRMLELSAD